jgi:ATP-binding cassette subfamily A (ABC1) protein 3
MEETEALCSNIGIMVNGELKCLGSLQQLKSRYGEGYSLLAKIALVDQNSAAQSANVDEFIRFVLDEFRGRSQLKENRDGYVNIHVDDNSTYALSSLFSLIEGVKAKYAIEFYVVTQTKLEQIFLNFASRQIDPSTRYKK